MVLKVVDMRHSASATSQPKPPSQPMASPGQARSVAALYLAAGARPDEIDGAVAVQIELEQNALAPTSYAEVANGPIRALTEYRNRQQTYTAIEEKA